VSRKFALCNKQRAIDAACVSPEDREAYLRENAVQVVADRDEKILKLRNRIRVIEKSLRFVKLANRHARKLLAKIAALATQDLNTSMAGEILREIESIARENNRRG